MNQSIAELKQQRLNKLFDDCQQQVISQIIGPFGLSTAMFEDRNGGNVTTLHNFKREDSDYVATNSDKKLHAQSKKKYDEAVRSGYEVKRSKPKVQAKRFGKIYGRTKSNKARMNIPGAMFLLMERSN